jgi:hypothetical protein
MSRASLLAASILWCFLVALMGYVAEPLYAMEESLHTATGSVAAINTKDSPPTILVMGKAAMSNEVVTIGAVVKNDAKIMRGTQRIALDRIRVGEEVTITYVKSRHGLRARSIVARPKK